MSRPGYDRDYYLANRERILAKSKGYALAHAEEVRRKRRESYLRRMADPEYRALRLAQQRKYKRSEKCHARRRELAARPEAKAKRREYRAANRERINKYQEAWRAAHPDRVHEFNARAYQKRKPQQREYQRQWKLKNPEKAAALKLASMSRNRIPEVASEIRKRQRVAYAVKRLAAGKMYRPRLRVRLPEWCAAGQDRVDWEAYARTINPSLEQIAYARELATERKKWRESHGRV